MIFNIIILFLSFLVLYFFSEQLGPLLGFVGAGAGLALIYVIPSIINMIYYRRKHPAIKSGAENLAEMLSEVNETEDTEDTGLVEGEKTKPQNQFKNIMFYIANGLIMIFGVFTLITQIVPINFFGIELE